MNRIRFHEAHFRIPSERIAVFFFAQAQTNPLIIWMMVNYNFLCLLLINKWLYGGYYSTLYTNKNDQKIIELVQVKVGCVPG